MACFLLSILLLYMNSQESWGFNYAGMSSYKLDGNLKWFNIIRMGYDFIGRGHPIFLCSRSSLYYTLSIMESGMFQSTEFRRYNGPVACVKVLVVDANSTCRLIVSKMLLSLGYEVVTARLASDALSIIEEKKNELNLVLVDAHLPDMEIYELMEKIRKSSDLPSFIMTADDDYHPSISRALCEGAKLCLRKPVRIFDLQDLWRFATWNRNETVISEEVPGFEWHQSEMIIGSKGLACQPSMNTGNPYLQHTEGKEPELLDKDNRVKKVLKRKSRTWNDNLHNKFLEAVESAGACAPPRKIFQLMNVPGLTRSRVSNYLQKYRRTMQLEADALQQHVNSDASLTGNDRGKHPPSFNQKDSMQFLGPPGELMNNVNGDAYANINQVKNTIDGKVINEYTFLSHAYSPTAGQQSYFSTLLANDICQQFSPQLPIALLPSDEKEDGILGAGMFNEIFYSKGTQQFTDEDLKMWLSIIPDALNNAVV